MGWHLTTQWNGPASRAVTAGDSSRESGSLQLAARGPVGSGPDDYSPNVAWHSRQIGCTRAREMNSSFASLSVVCEPWQRTQVIDTLSWSRIAW